MQKLEEKNKKLKELDEIKQNFLSERNMKSRKTVIQTPTFTKVIDEEGNSVIN